jgi:hypothetical protein
LLYERALKFLPGSYKLWWAYLQVRERGREGGEREGWKEVGVCVLFFL